MNIKKYINPIEMINQIKYSRKILSNQKKYTSILNDLEEEGKIKASGLRKDGNKLYLGINLNPELLIYDENTQESAELKFIAEKMKKHTDFLQKEGILDSAIADYERVKNEDFYGYVVEIRFDAKEYSKKDYIYALSYFPVLTLLASIAIMILI